MKQETEVGLSLGWVFSKFSRCFYSPQKTTVGFWGFSTVVSWC